MLARVPELLLFLKCWRPDLLHCHLPLAGVIGRLLGWILNVPVVYTEHNLQERYHPLTRLVNRLTWTWQDRVVAVSAEVGESIAKSMPERTAVQTVLNGVDCDVFRPRADSRAEKRKEFGLSESDFLVGTVAVFRKQKRLDLWLDVARRLALEHDNVYFLLVGDGPEMPLVRRLVAEYGLTSRVHLPGLKSDVRSFYCAMDVFFMSSDFEGLPVALLEAIACQTPVVATAVGGIGEVIQSDSQGLLANKGDWQELLRHLRRLLVDPGLRDDIAEQGRRRVLLAFSLATMAQELERLYLEVSGGRETHFKPPKDLPGYVQVLSASEQESLELIKASLGEGSRRSPRTPEFFRWKHKTSPFGASYSLALRSEMDGELAGIRLFQRWDLARDLEVVSAVRAVDTSTHPKHQRKGVFTYLTRTALVALEADGVDLVFNTPNSNSLPGYLKMGWELVDRIPIQGRLLRGFSKVRLEAHDFETLVQGCEEEQIMSLIDGARVPGKNQIRKSINYLRWRYSEHPTVDYRFSVLEQDKVIHGLAVWCETERKGLTELVVCELFARTGQSCAELLGNVIRSSSSHYSVAVFTNNPIASEAMRQNGFRQIPFKRISFVVKPLSSSLGQILNRESWTLSTGDLQVF